jgi:diketogulonate reductase-like aldo/keto reductase
VTSRREFVRIGGAATLAWSWPGLASAASASMLQRPIPSTGERLPVIGLGTWQTFDVGPSAADRAPLETVLREFVRLGGRLIDSSPMYGRSEAVVGDLAARLGIRKQLFVATKVWTTGRDAGIKQLETSLGLLRADPIDLLQVHNLVDVETHLATLRAWKDAGRVRYIGITHYQSRAFEDLARIIRARPIDFVQLNYSIAVRDAERMLLPLAAERGVAVIVNRPFESGGLFGRLRDRPLPPLAAELECRTWSQFLLKYVVSHPAVTCAIPATANPDHLRDNMAAGLGPMPDEATRRRMVAAVGL